MSAATGLSLLGIAAGLGVLLVAAGVIRREALPTTDDSGSGDYLRDLMAGAGIGLQRLAMADGRGSRRDEDLAITARTLEAHGLATASATLAGALVPLGLSTALSVAGLRLPPEVPLGCTILGAAAGLAGALLELRAAASNKRAAFRRSLSSWLDLVVLAQAGGMGVEGALDSASRISCDEPFSLIRAALEAGRHAGSTPWDTLARLGRELGVGELEELAASLGLAGSEGARIRSSLSAKAASLRRAQLSEAEAKANSTTERLFLPSIVLMLGFMVFLMYPAGVSLAHVL